MDWLATKQATKRAATAARYESHLRLHVLPAFGPMPVAGITRHEVQQWINSLARDNLSASTIGDIYRGVFKAVLNKAILDGRLAVSPCHRIELPQPVAEEVVPPTPERGSPRLPGSRSAGCAGDPVRLRIDRQLLPGPPGHRCIPGRVPARGSRPLLPRAVGATEIGRRRPRPAGASPDRSRRRGAPAGMRPGAVRAAV